MLDSHTPWWRAPATRVQLGQHSAVRNGQGDSLGLSFWALMGFTFVLLLAPQERFPALAPLRIAMLSVVLAVLAHTLNRIVKGRPVIEFGPPVKMVLCLVGWALITLPFSLWLGGSVDFLLQNFGKTLIVFILLANVIDNFAKLKGMILGLVLMSIPLALTTVGNFVSGTSLEVGDRVAGYSGALTANPNDLALMLNLILPLCIAMLLGARRTSFKILLGSIACLLVVAIIATFSRAGFLTLGLTCLCYAWLLRKRPQRVWLPALLMVVVFALPAIPSSYVQRLNTIVNIEEDASHSAQTRLRDMKVAIKVVVANPVIGAGIGMNQLAMNRARGVTWTEIHNVYLQLAVELGVPGLALFLLLYGKCLATTKNIIRRCARNSGFRDFLFMTEGLQVSLIAFALAAMFHPVAYHFYFYIIAGLAVAAGAIFSRETKEMFSEA